MGRISNAQTSFNGGEWSPLLKERQDLEKYKNALATCLNGIPLAQGGWTRRPGTEYIHSAHGFASYEPGRLFRFEYSASQAYVIEVTPLGKFRFYTEGAILTTGVPRTPSAISRANPCVVTHNAHGIANGTRLVWRGMTGMTQLEGQEVQVANATANTYEMLLPGGTLINSTNYDTYTGGAAYHIVEVASPYGNNSMAPLRMVQVGDIAYFVDGINPPKILTRTSAIAFTLTTFQPLDGPYLALNTTAITITPSVSAVGASGTLTASGTLFVSTDVGRVVRIKIGANWGWVRITGFTSDISVNMTVFGTLGGTTATLLWRLGAWPGLALAGSQPAVVAVHENRLTFAGATSAPNRIDMSKSAGDHSSFEPTAPDGTVANDNAISYTFNAKDSNAVQWMVSSEKGLLVGTTSAEWVIRPSSQNEALTPANVTSKPSTDEGSASIDAQPAGDAFLFVQRGGQRLRELAYVFEADGFRSPDMTLLSEHITRPGIARLTYQHQPQEIAWAPRTDGVLLGFTYERAQNVTAWHRHELGGASDAAGLLVPVIEDAVTLVSDDGTRDEVWLLLRRYINGGDVRYIERMSKLWTYGDAKEDALYLDCARKRTGASTVTVTGLMHLEGQTVSILADGNAHPDVTVTNGKITLNVAASKVMIGYRYPSDGQSMPLAGGSQDGSSQGKLGRIVRVGFHLLDTLGFKYGLSADELTELVGAEYGELFGAGTGLMSGVVRCSLGGESSRSRQVFWRCDGPFPATLLALTTQADVSDDS